MTEDHDRMIVAETRSALSELSSGGGTNGRPPQGVPTLGHQPLDHCQPIYRVGITFGHPNKWGPLSAFRVWRVTRQLTRAITRLFGGAQAHGHHGGYQRKDGPLIYQRASTVWAYTHEIEPQFAALKWVAAWTCRALSQV